MAKKAKKVNKTTKSRTGAQFFQSDQQKEERRRRGGEKTKTERAIDDALLEKVISGEMTGKDAGTLSANVFIDSVEDVHRKTDGQKTKASGTGRAVMKGRGGSFKGVN